MCVFKKKYFRRCYVTIPYQLIFFFKNELFLIADVPQRTLNVGYHMVLVHCKLRTGEYNR